MFRCRWRASRRMFLAKQRRFRSLFGLARVMGASGLTLRGLGVTVRPTVAGTAAGTTLSMGKGFACFAILPWSAGASGRLCGSSQGKGSMVANYLSDPIESAFTVTYCGHSGYSRKMHSPEAPLDCQTQSGIPHDPRLSSRFGSAVRSLHQETDSLLRLRASNACAPLACSRPWRWVNPNLRS